jgi:alkyl hydroperoxide reductase subunit F
MYDQIIIGGGPAGITAAIYSARKKMNVLVITKDIGGQAALTADIENYTGFQFISGSELAKKFEEQVKQFDNIELKNNEEVECAQRQEDGHFEVKTNKGQYQSMTVIICSGRKPKLLNVPGEADFKYKGVTYCSTCDGPLFAGKDVAIIGGGNSALYSTLHMIKIAKKIYLITLNDRLIGEDVMIEKALDADNVEVLYNTKTKEIKGDTFVNSIVIEKDGEEKTLEVQGVFVEIGSDPVNTPACNTVEMNKWQELVVNDRCETNVPGLFAAGDVTNVPYKQIIVAAGQGCTASMSASEYLDKLKK